MTNLFRPLAFMGLTTLGLGVLSCCHFIQGDQSPVQPAPAPQNQLAAKSPVAVSLPPIVEWDSSNGNPPSWLKRSESDELSHKMEEAIRDRLEQRLDAAYNQKPLSFVMKSLADELQVPILLDDKALQDESISPDEPITLELQNAKARNILAFVLGPLVLTYKIDKEAIMITSLKSEANTVRYYDLSFVFPDNSLSSEVIRLIESIVEPHQWLSAGGQSSMQLIGSILVVSAPESSHLAIEDLLRNISKQSRGNMKPARVPSAFGVGVNKGFPPVAPQPGGMM